MTQASDATMLRSFMKLAALTVAAVVALVWAPGTAHAGWKINRATAIAQVVWHHPCVDQARLEWVSQERLDALTGGPKDDVIAVEGADAATCTIYMGPVKTTWSEFCDTVIHGAGHLAGFRDPSNVDDPLHSANPRSVMAAGDVVGGWTNVNGRILEIPDTDPRCRDRGRPFMVAHGLRGRPFMVAHGLL